MKALCSACGKVGVVKQRGKSIRVIHYEYQNGKRIFVKHLVNGNSIVGTMGTALGTEKAQKTIFNEIEASPVGCA